MKHRRNFLTAAWAGILGLFGGKAAASAGPYRESQSVVNKLRTQLAEAEAEQECVWNAWLSGESYIVDGYVVQLHQGVGGDVWITDCNTLHVHSGGDTKEEALQETREDIAWSLGFLLDEDMDIPPPDVEARCLESVWPLVETDMLAKCGLPSVRVAVPDWEGVNAHLRQHRNVVAAVDALCEEAVKHITADTRLELEVYACPAEGYDSLRLCLRSASVSPGARLDVEGELYQRLWNEARAISDATADLRFARLCPEEDVFVEADGRAPKGHTA